MHLRGFGKVLPAAAMVIRRPLAAREVTIVRRMKKLLQMRVTDIATAVDRNKSSVYKALSPSWVAQKRGRPRKLTAKEVQRIISVIKAMVQRARGRWEVTMAMIKKKAKCQASTRCLREALKRKNIKFRRLRSKIQLSKEDRAARRAFALKYKGKPISFWQRQILLHIDVKSFPVYTTKAGRDVAAQRAVRGAYRLPGQGLDEAYVLAPKDARYHPGVKSVKVAGGVSPKKTLVWEQLKGKWTGAAAAKLYRGPVQKALRREYPGKRKFSVLEDNDPTGWKSKKGIAAKKAAKIAVFRIPPRSPDLNVLDYAVWTEINKRMRRQERKFSKQKVETKQAYLKRLDGTARRLGEGFLRRSIADMKRRCQRLHDAKGGHFHEGR